MKDSQEEGNQQQDRERGPRATDSPHSRSIIGVGLAAIGALWLGVLAWFWPVITPDVGARRYIGPGDLMEQFFQYQTFAARELARGRLAQWDPFMYAGHPFQADTQTAVLYPIALANEWLNRASYSFLDLEWEVVLHVGLAATFTFLLVRLLTGSALAGMLAGAVFAFGGFLTSYPLDQIAVLRSTVWLPLVIYSIERAARARARRQSLWLGLSGVWVALAILGGHPQTWLYEAYLTVAYFLFRLPWRAWWKGAWLGLAALGLAAVQLLPSQQLVSLSERGRPDYGFAAGGLQPSDLLALLTAWPEAGKILYVGLVPLGFAVLALVAVRSRQVLFWTALVVISALLSLGTHGPLFRWFFDYLPGWNLFRDQERVVVWLALGLAILAGFGLTWLQRRRWRLSAGLGLALVVVSFGNLAWMNSANRLTSVPPPDASDVSGFLAPVLSDGDVFRVRVGETSIGHNDGNLLGLQFVTGDSVLELASFKRWTEDTPEGPRATEWQLLRLTNTHYVVSSRPLCQAACTPADGLELVTTDDKPRQLPETDPLPRFANVSALWLYRVLYPLPRAYFVTQAEGVGSERQAIDVINRPGFDGGQTVLLQGASVPHSSAPDAAARLQTDVTGWAPGFLEVRTSSDRAAYLVASEVAYPEWQATVDGHDTAIRTADGLFMALDVPPGDHHVVFRFVPRRFYLGAVISALTAIVLLAVAAVAWRRSR